MEEYYIKKDDRKPWQKNMGIAVIVFIVLIVSDVLETIADNILMAVHNLVKNLRNKKKSPAPQRASYKKQAHQDVANSFQTYN